MGAVTYADPNVVRYLNAHFVPVQFNVVDQPEAMEQFNSSWTPTILVQDADGKEHRRAQGYLDPERFLAELALGRMKTAIDRQAFSEASALADETLRQADGDPTRLPEAQYWAAVAHYKASHDPHMLMNGWNQLLQQFPQSEWAKRAEFIRM